MSATNTGTPAFESWPAISCSVLVLPVPVAPAIRPWRLSMLSATWTRASLASSPSSIGLPMTRPGSVRAYPAVIASWKALSIGPPGQSRRSGEVGKGIIDPSRIGRFTEEGDA